MLQIKLRTFNDLWGQCRIKWAHYLTKRTSLLIWICKKLWHWISRALCNKLHHLHWIWTHQIRSATVTICLCMSCVPIRASVRVNMDQQWQQIPALKLVSATSSDAQTAAMLAWQQVTMASVHRNSVRPRLNLKFPSGRQSLLHKDRITSTWEWTT